MPLYDDSDTLITDYLWATPSYDVIKVVNRLLDGSHHTQTIGNPAKILKCDVIVESEAAKDAIDFIHGIGANLKAVTRGKHWTGPIIDSNLVWTWRKLDLWSTSFVISVIQEGTV